MSKNTLMILLIALTLLTGKAEAVWPETVEDLNYLQYGPYYGSNFWYHAIPSVSGRTIITWDDDWFDFTCPKYQIIDRYGNWMFQQNQPAADTTSVFVTYEAIPDGEGGAVFLLRKFVQGIEDYIYIQRIDSMGNKLWGDNGVQVAYGTGNPIGWNLICCDLLRDEFTGDYFVFYSRFNSNYSLIKLQVQKLDANANALWPGEGVVLADSGLGSGTENMYNCLASDMNGGVYAVWYRGEGDIQHYKIYMQHLDANGNRLWQDYGRGKFIYDAGTTIIDCPELLSDGVGGVYVSDTQYIKRYLPDGTMDWQAIAYGGRNFLHKGDAGDFYITSVCYQGSGFIMNAQHFNREGQSLWPGNYLQLSSHPYDDGSMYLYGAFFENNYLFVSFSSTDSRDIIVSQKASSDGILQWGNGIITASSAHNLNLERAACSDQAGGLIVEFTNSFYDNCAKRVRADGTLGGDYAQIEYVTISMQGNDAVITWPAQYENARYNIYKMESPYIVTIPPIATITDTFYVDTGAANEGAAFYRVSWEIGN